ncbi:MAG: tRNA (guanosine(37)-N1)-methyltransferase TrmD [Candidatus Kapaibacterium sp.]
MSAIRFDFLSSLPESLTSVLNTGILRIGQEKDLVEFHIHNLHDYSDNKFGHIDDTPYGGGAGMLIKCQPVFDCINKLKDEREYDEIIFVTPEGELFNQSLANELSLKKNIMILSGRYKGIDQRIRDSLITREISVGDFVLSGGELPTLIIADAITRLIPGALGDSESALTDSHMDGLLESPQYTRPAEYKGMKVPEVLTSGNHKLVREWQEKSAREKTEKLRPDLLK